MLAYIAKRLLVSALVLGVVSMITFGLLRLSGDLATALAGENAGAEYVNFLRQQYGWDRPILVQYFDWLGRTLSGDLGQSFYFGGSASALLLDRIPVTMTLAFVALGFAVFLAIPLGVVAAIRPDSLIDRFVLAVSLFGQAMPSFWFSYLLIMWLGLNLNLLPISGSTTAAHFIMPGIALGYYAAPAFMRLTRAGMIEVLASDYIRTAYAKGLRKPTVLFKHALRNALVPVVSVAAVQFGFMLGGSVIIETVFALHGLGYLAWEAISQGDYPVVQSIVLVVSTFYVLLTLLADLLNALIDPRIRVAGRT